MTPHISVKALDWKGLASLSDFEKTLTASRFRPFTNVIAPVQVSSTPLMLYHLMNINKYCQLTLAPKSRLAVLDNLTHPGWWVFWVWLLKTDMSDKDRNLFNWATSHVSDNFSFTSLSQKKKHTYKHKHTLTDVTAWSTQSSGSRIVKVMILLKCAERWMSNRRLCALWESRKYIFMATLLSRKNWLFMLHLMYTVH